MEKSHTVHTFTDRKGKDRKIRAINSALWRQEEKEEGGDESMNDEANCKKEEKQGQKKTEKGCTIYRDKCLHPSAIY